MPIKDFKEKIEKVWTDAVLQSIRARGLGEDHAGLIIDIHLRLEHTLVEILQHRLPRPSDLEIDNLEFRAKVNIASACGFVPGREAVLYINTIRNRLAHRLDYKITHDIADHLDKCIREDIKFDDDRLKVPPLRRFADASCYIGGALHGWNEAVLSHASRAVPDPRPDP